MFVKNLLEDLGEELGSWAHINSTMTRKLMWPTLIGPFSVLLYLKWRVIKEGHTKNCYVKGEKKCDQCYLFFKMNHKIAPINLLLPKLSFMFCP